jgi:hypothetical protein
MTLAEMDRLFDCWWANEGRWSFTATEQFRQKPLARYAFIAALRVLHGVTLATA